MAAKPQKVMTDITAFRNMASGDFWLVFFFLVRLLAVLTLWIPVRSDLQHAANKHEATQPARRHLLSGYLQAYGRLVPSVRTPE